MSRIIGKNIILREYQEQDLISIHKWTTDNLSEIFYSSQTLHKTEDFIKFITEKKTDNYF